MLLSAKRGIWSRQSPRMILSKQWRFLLLGFHAIFRSTLSVNAKIATRRLISSIQNSRFSICIFGSTLFVLARLPRVLFAAAADEQTQARQWRAADYQAGSLG